MTSKEIDMMVDDLVGSRLVGTVYLPPDFLMPGAAIPKADPPNPFERSIADNVPMTLSHRMKDGLFYTKRVPVLDRKSIEDMLLVLVSNPFKGDLEKMQEYMDGKQASLLERSALALGMLASTGKLEAIEYLFDRLLGKPTQQTQSVSANLTYEDYLKHIANQDNDDGCESSEDS